MVTTDLDGLDTWTDLVTAYSDGTRVSISTVVFVSADLVAADSDGLETWSDLVTTYSDGTRVPNSTEVFVSADLVGKRVSASRVDLAVIPT